jgi:3-isopropylmalate/(R)-2-methylmalate dehydratase small subunit
MQVKGYVIKYGDNIDTDVIIPARYLNTTDENELAQHCMEDLDPDFRAKLRGGDILVAGSNFGCGSSREHAPIAIKSCGVSCVIASDFARIFYRNSINIGLPILECPRAAAECSEGDMLEVDFGSGIIHNVTKNLKYEAVPFPDFLQGIISSGGLMNMAAELVRGEPK